MSTCKPGPMPAYTAMSLEGPSGRIALFERVWPALKFLLEVAGDVEDEVGVGAATRSQIH
jgi:hypothetical protein